MKILKYNSWYVRDAPFKWYGRDGSCCAASYCFVGRHAAVSFNNDGYVPYTAFYTADPCRRMNLKEMMKTGKKAVSSLVSNCPFRTVLLYRKEGVGYNGDENGTKGTVPHVPKEVGYAEDCEEEKRDEHLPCDPAGDQPADHL